MAYPYAAAETSSSTASRFAPVSKGRIVVSWITSTDHKTIGYLYLITSFLFFCFGGVMVARLVAGDSPVDAARAGCAAAALSTTGYGAIDPLPTRQQIRDVLSIDDVTSW